MVAAPQTAIGARLLALLSALALLWATQGARADEHALQLPLLSPDGLNGGRYVGSALNAQRPSLRLASSLGYGLTESVLGAHDRHHRLAGELALALIYAPWLQASLSGELRVDRHTPDGPGSETGVLGSSRLATRHVLELGSRLALGFAPTVHFPGAASVRRGFRAASYELVLLASLRLPADLELTLNGGYRFDRTRFAVVASQLAEAQRLAAALSRHNAYMLGALLSAPLAGFQLSLEWSWELQTAGRALASPMRVRAALQRAIGERLVPGIEVGMDTSTRPELQGLMRIEPRLWVRLGLAIALERRPPPRPQAAAATLAAAPVPQLRSVTLRIVDLDGLPIAGAHVAVPGEAEHEVHMTDSRGEVALLLGEGVTAVTVESEGYEPLWRTLDAAVAQQPVVLKPGLPAAEIKGIVRNLAGDPVRATVTVLPQAVTVTSDARGQFAIGVAPGDYTLKIVADDYEPQERRAQVELRGVTIIVIDLRKVTK